uniref:Uncharacterized protein n=1 Tax=Physcomitrium patens TaxID=3218 RepID=A0A7I4AJ35_PHYPA
MGTLTDPTVDPADPHVKADDGAGLIDAGQVHPERLETLAEDQSQRDGANGVHFPVKTNTGNAAESTASTENGETGSIDVGKLRTKPSPVQTHIHRGGSEGLYRGASGGIYRSASGSTHIHRGASGGILRGQSGGIHRGRSGAIHLPSLQSISFSMTRLPEEDAGVMMHFTETKETETTPESSRASDEDAPTPKKKHRLRKHLTAIGAYSFAFRFSETVLSLIAIVVMCSTRGSMRTDGVDFGTLKFNHFQAYRLNTMQFVDADI